MSTDVLSRRDAAEANGWHFGTSGPRLGCKPFARRGEDFVRGTWEEVFAGIDKIEAERVAARVRRFDRDDAEAAGWIVRAQTQTRAGQVWVGIKPLPRLPEHISYDAEECVEHTIHGDDLYDVLRQIETIEKGKPQ